MFAPGDTHAALTQPAPAQASGGFPPFDQTTFPSQIFWLVVTFAFLFVVMWRIAGPRINGVITSRRAKINGDIAEAQKHRGDAEAASVAYQTALAGARARASAHAEENRKRIVDEVDKAKLAADRDAQAAMAKAESRIHETRVQAESSVQQAARDAAIVIVARLTGDTVSPADADNAVKSASGA